MATLNRGQDSISFGTRVDRANVPVFWSSLGANGLRVGGSHGGAVNEPFGVFGVDVGIKPRHGLAVKGVHVCGISTYVAETGSASNSASKSSRTEVMMLVEVYVPLFNQNECAHTPPVFVLSSITRSLASLPYTSVTERELRSIR